MARAGEEIASIRLQQDRVSELLDELEDQNRQIRQTERELLRLAKASGITREAVIERLSGREFDQTWVAEAASLKDRAWRSLARTQGPRLAEITAAFKAIGDRLGMSIEEARVALFEVSRARRRLAPLLSRARVTVLPCTPRFLRGLTEDVPSLRLVILAAAGPIFSSGPPPVPTSCRLNGFASLLSV